MPEAKPLSTPAVIARIVLGGCLLTVAACGGPDTEDAIARAERELAAGDYPAAIIDLKTALANDSDDGLPRARWLLGKAYLDTGDMASAQKELEHAYQLGWNPNEVLPGLARSLLARGEFEAVVELPAEQLEPQAKAKLQAARALATLAQGDSWEADSLIAEALELQPDDADVRLAEARIMGTMGDIAGALAVVDKVLATAPQSQPGWSMKGELLSLQQRLPEAVTALDTAIELLPGSFDDRSRRALINLQLQNFDAAGVDGDWLLKASPQHPMSNYVSGLLYFHDANYPDCITALGLAEPLAGRFPLVLFYLSAAHQMEGHREAALGAANRLVRGSPDFAPGRMLLASIYLQERKPGDVPGLLRPVLDRYPEDIKAMNLLANALMMEGKTDQALDLLARAQELDPDSAEASFRLGAGLLLAGRGEAATQRLEAALELDPQYQRADVLMILRLLHEENFEAAIKAAQAYSARNPVSVTAHSLLGRAYLANQQTREAAAAFREALALVPEDPAANHALAQIAAQAGEIGVARDHYQAILEGRPDYLPALLQLVLLDAAEGDEAAMMAGLNHAIEVHPAALEPRLMLGRRYLWTNEPAKVPPLFSTVTELQKQSPQVLHLLALAQLAEQEHSKALYTLEQLVKLEPNTALAHHLLGTAAAGSGDFDKAEEEFRRTLELDENYTPAMVSLARLAWANGEMALFEQYLQRLVQLVPDAPDVLRLQAAAARQAGDMERAIELAESAWATAPGTDSTLELAGYQFMSGNSAEALRIVETWVAEHPGDVRARMALASQFTHAASIDKAIEQYKAVLALEPDNVGALNNLAWELRLKDPKAARAHARRAVTLDPGDPRVLDTLAMVEHLAGDHREAQRHIGRAIVASPDSTALLYHQAMIEAALGDNSAAIDILQKLLAANTAEFTERHDAELLLASLRQD